MDILFIVFLHGEYLGASSQLGFRSPVLQGSTIANGHLQQYFSGPEYISLRFGDCFLKYGYLTLFFNVSHLTAKILILYCVLFQICRNKQNASVDFPQVSFLYSSTGSAEMCSKFLCLYLVFNFTIC